MLAYSMKNEMQVKVHLCCWGSVLLLINLILLALWTLFNIVFDHVFHTPLASWEVVAHSNISVIFRITSRSFAYLLEAEFLCNVVLAFSLTSELTTFPLAARAIYIGLIAFLTPNSFLLFEHLIFPLPGMLFPSTHPFSQMTH